MNPKFSLWWLFNRILQAKLVIITLYWNQLLPVTGYQILLQQNCTCFYLLLLLLLLLSIFLLLLLLSILLLLLHYSLLLTTTSIQLFMTLLWNHYPMVIWQKNSKRWHFLMWLLIKVHVSGGPNFYALKPKNLENLPQFLTLPFPPPPPKKEKKRKKLCLFAWP